MSSLNLELANTIVTAALQKARDMNTAPGCNPLPNHSPLGPIEKSLVDET